MTLFMALLLALVVSALVLAVLLRLAPRTGLMDHPGERRRIHREAVPRVGGLAIFAGLLVSLVVAPPLTAAERYGLAGAALLVLVGALDDRHQLGPRVRLLAQFGAGLLLTLGGGVVIPSVGDLLGTGPLVLGAWAVPFTLVAVVGLINALNMIDGIDGLATGVTVIAMGGLLVYLPPGPLPGVLLATLAALVPYLLCNLGPCPRRWKVFLGDAGSMLLGYLIVWGLIEASRAPGGLAPVTALWLVAIPLMDTLGFARHVLEPHTLDVMASVAGDIALAVDRARAIREVEESRRLLQVTLAGIGDAGQALAVPEALMFYLALAVFGGYLGISQRWPVWHRQRLRQRRTAPLKPAGEGKA